MPSLVSSRRCLFGIVLAAALIWKSWRTDWVASCQFASADFHPPVSVEQRQAMYRPPVSPLWNPPTAAALTGRAEADWSDAEFFPAGGSYGPTSEPRLQVDVWTMAWKILLPALLAGLLAPVRQESEG